MACPSFTRCTTQEIQHLERAYESIVRVSPICRPFSVFSNMNDPISLINNHRSEPLQRTKCRRDLQLANFDGWRILDKM
ncbi:hypothetical protein LshimejAT787_2300490 [Lyophyllum shimeji]|uniref:Uncharacterized protein n=1 Tax=Lyophyllum shimeji TaxID=47721 RepID=A0A9P3URT9_LYOSH|nr:hypothetical protein LshimejAT787_2300490 [Lyophyllum shimeji]